MRATLPLLALLAACTDGEARTLQNCETSVSTDVPAFFQELYLCADISLAGDSVTVSTTDLPPHPSPYYPTTDPNWEEWDDRGGDWHQNPNTISEQAKTFTIPVEPTAKGIMITADMVDLSAGTSDDEYPGGVGLALDGTLIFAAMAAPGDDITEEKYTFDTWEGHPEMTGTYHHHSATPGPLAVLVEVGWATTDVPGSAEIEVYGVMCDGTVMMGCTELDGSAPDDSDLDAQAGHVHDLVAADGTTYFAERYHTHVCDGAYGHDYSPEIQYYEGCEDVTP